MTPQFDAIIASALTAIEANIRAKEVEIASAGPTSLSPDPEKVKVLETEKKDLEGHKGALLSGNKLTIDINHVIQSLGVASDDPQAIEAKNSQEALAKLQQELEKIAQARAALVAIVPVDERPPS